MEGVPAESTVSDAFGRMFQQRAGAGAALSFADFMDLALYDQEVGYYKVARTRVARDRGADFVTSSTFDLVFGLLVAGAARGLLAPESPEDFAFVEIGAEPGRSVLDGKTHPFPSTSALRVGDKIEIPKQAVVFSNELFDAQPFHRVVFRNGEWRELGVSLKDRTSSWTEFPAPSTDVESIRNWLPEAAPENYTIDLPIRAQRLLEAIATPSWKGVFIAFDYGRTWSELTNGHPEGTGRAYHQHRQIRDLLATPGRQDLTCHVCWDWMEESLRAAGFQSVTRSSQESFFLNHATSAVEEVMASDPNPLSPARSQLKQLLHPGLMGQRFEVLWGIRL